MTLSMLKKSMPQWVKILISTMVRKSLGVKNKNIARALPSYAYLSSLMSNYQVKDLVYVDPKSFKRKIDEFLQLQDYKMEGFKSPDKQRDLSVRFHWGHNHDFGDFSLKGRMGDRHLLLLATFIDKFGAIPRSLDGLKVLKLLTNNNDKKNFVFGLDGATCDIIMPLVQQEKLLAFKKILDEGAWGVLESTILPFTLPAWNTAITGVTPIKHGIFDFFRIENINEYPVQKINSSLNRKYPTIFEVLSQYGKQSLLVNIPGTFPPKKDPNIITITGMLTSDEDSNFFYPLR